jgi:hypothetical protein
VAAARAQGADESNIKLQGFLQQGNVELGVVGEDADDRAGVDAPGRAFRGEIPVRPVSGHLVRGGETLLRRERRPGIAQRDAVAEQLRGRHQRRAEVVGAKHQEPGLRQAALHQQRHGFGRRHPTISTVGVPPGNATALRRCQPDQPRPAAAQQRFELGGGCQERFLPGLSVQIQSVQSQQCRELRRSRNPKSARIRNHDDGGRLGDRNTRLPGGPQCAAGHGPARHAPAGNTVDAPDQRQRPFGVAARELLEGSEPAGAAVQGLDMDLQLTAAGEPDGERVLAAEAKSLKAGAAVGHHFQRRGNHGTLNTAAGEAAEDLAGFGHQHGGPGRPRHGAAGGDDGGDGAPFPRRRRAPAGQRRHQIQHGSTPSFRAMVPIFSFLFLVVESIRRRSGPATRKRSGDARISVSSGHLRVAGRFPRP